MTELRTAAQQALEALVSENSLSAVAMQQRMDAIIALRAALADPVPDSKNLTIAEWYADKQLTPLTDGQIHDCFQQKHKDKVTERRLITRAIERAHGIRGNDE